MTDRETERYYRKRAAEYEQIYFRDDAGRRAELAAEAERLTALVSGKRVLEFACGTGYWTHVMSRTAQSIVAVDLAPEMLAEAGRKDYDCHVSFVESDMYSYQGSDRMADVIAFGFWFSHHPRQDYDRLFDLIDRYLDQRGTVWMVDNNPPAESGSLHDHSHKDDHGNNFKHRTVSDGTRFVVLKNYFTEESLNSIFEPRFAFDRLTYGHFYWALELRRK
jgi:ubiquinone/menaquinone biosynthesis C-methylase UbiE